MGGINAGYCGLHKMPAGECFHLHSPDAFRTDKFKLSTMESFVLDALREGTKIKLDLVAGKDNKKFGELFELLSHIEREQRTRFEEQIIAP